MADYDELNREIPDPTPIAMPLGYDRPETLAQIMSRMIQQNQHIAKLAELETAEEADDFYVEDDDEIQFTSKHEFEDMQEEFIQEKEETTPETPETETTKAEDPTPENTQETPKGIPVEN